jgi:hypothetical protein
MKDEMHKTLYTYQTTNFINDFSCKDVNKKMFILFFVTMEPLSIYNHGVYLFINNIYNSMIKLK